MRERERERDFHSFEEGFKQQLCPPYVIRPDAIDDIRRKISEQEGKITKEFGSLENCNCFYKEFGSLENCNSFYNKWRNKLWRDDVVSLGYNKKHGML